MALNDRVGSQSKVLLALLGLTGAAAITYYLSADHEMLFEEPRKATTRWALGLIAFIAPLVLRRSISALTSALAIIGGITAAAIIWVLITGPGNIWPIAIVMIVIFGSVPVIMGAGGAFLAQKAAVMIKGKRT